MIPLVPMGLVSVTKMRYMTDIGAYISYRIKQTGKYVVPVYTRPHAMDTSQNESSGRISIVTYDDDWQLRPGSVNRASSLEQQQHHEMMQH